VRYERAHERSGARHERSEMHGLNISEANMKVIVEMKLNYYEIK
jgi:hypothetical protein